MDTGLKPWVVALGLYKSSGGPTKTIASFREALGAAPMVNFVDPVVANREEWAMPEATVLQASSLPGLHSWCQPDRASLQALESRLVQEASLLSCHSFFRFHNRWTFRMKKRYGIPYWFVPHGSLDPFVLESGKLAKKLFIQSCGQEFLREASCVIFSTEAEWEKAESVYGKLNGQVVPWPVELPCTEKGFQHRASMRQKWNIPENDVVLLYFGRLHSMKKPLETIELVASLQDADVHLVMMGPESDISADACRRRASAVGFSNLHMLGPVYGEEKFQVIGACDAYLSLSSRENFNHTAAECMALGVPVLLSRGNDLGSQVEAAGGGVWMRDESRASSSYLAEFVKTVRTDSQTLGQAARSWVQNTLSFDTFLKHLQHLVNTYERIS